MPELSEKDIKHIVLGYLKSYYKYRPRSSENTARLDMIAPNGIVADGHISFRRDDGHLFLATFEASSAGTKHEVRYRRKGGQLLWDGMALGFSLCSLAFLSYYIRSGLSLRATGFLLSFLALVLFLMVLVLAVRELLWGLGLSRYRYILAIDRFQNYFADEQWVAIGSDVFLNPDDRYGRELRQQCVRNGFGLIRVDADSRHCQVLVTPAAREVIQKKRRRLPFAEQYDALRQRLQPRNWGGTWGERAGQLVYRAWDWYAHRQYHRLYPLQLLVIVLNISLLLGPFYREWLDPPVIVEDEMAYRRQLALLAKDLRREPNYFLRDTMRLRRFGLDTSNMAARPRLFDPEDMATFLAAARRDSAFHLIYPIPDVPSVDNGNDEDVLVAMFLEEKPIPEAERIPESYFLPEKIPDAYSFTERAGPGYGDMPPPVYVLPGSGKGALDCLSFATLKDTRHVVQDNVFESLPLAVERALYLNGRGYESSVVWMGCFEAGTRYYAVYFAQLFRDEADARRELGRLREAFRRERIPSNPLIIKTIVPMAGLQSSR